MATKKEITIQELIEKYAATPSVAKTLYNKLVKLGLDNKKALVDLSVNELVCGCGFGRSSLEVMIQVLCDLAGKK